MALDPPKGASSPKVVKESAHVILDSSCPEIEPSGTKVIPSELSGDVKKGLAALERITAEMRVLEKILPDSDDESILGCLESLFGIHIMYGFRVLDHESDRLYVAIVNSFALARNSGYHWIKYFKTRIADFFSSWKGQELSTFVYKNGENPRYLFGGPVYGFYQRIARSKEAMSFATSILMSKKGMPRATDDLVRKAEEDNVNVMITKKPKAPLFHWEAEHSSYIMGKEETKTEITRTVFELFRSWKPSLVELSQPFFPSSSSNYNRCRSKKGTYGEIITTRPWREFVKNIEKLSNGLAYSLTDTVVYDYVSDYYGALGREDESLTNDSEHYSRMAFGLGVHTSWFEACFKHLYWGLVQLAIEEKPLVEVVGLKEALKIRCISKGPPLTYFVLKPLQQMLWSHLKKNPIFRLTGEPISEDLMNERFPMDQFRGYRWHSGDYSAATDGLYSWASEVAASAVNMKFKDVNGFDLGPLYTLLVRALTGHIYVKKDISPEGVVTESYHPQKRGQLMGSIVSFPFLCILNCALMRRSLEISEERVIPLREFPGWINGDDCFTPYRCGDFPLIWETLAKQFGFEKSLGKTYDAADFGCMNSTTYTNISGSWELVRYINLGVFNAVKRSNSSNDGPDASASELGNLHNILMDTCPLHLRRSLTTAFLYRHRLVLQSEKLKSIPWFLPKWMGGLGLKNMESYTDEDRLYGYHALKEAAVRPVSFHTEKEWLHYDIYKEAVGEASDDLVVPVNFRSYSGDETYSRAFTAIVYCEGWVRLSLAELYNPFISKEELELKSIIAFHRRVQRRVGEAVKKNDFRHLKGDEAFISEAKRSVLPVFAI